MTKQSLRRKLPGLLPLLRRVDLRSRRGPIIVERNIALGRGLEHGLNESIVDLLKRRRPPARGLILVDNGRAYALREIVLPDEVGCDTVFDGERFLQGSEVLPPFLQFEGQLQAERRALR